MSNERRNRNGPDGDNNLVHPEQGCPSCGERDADRLVLAAEADKHVDGRSSECRCGLHCV